MTRNEEIVRSVCAGLGWLILFSHWMERKAVDTATHSSLQRQDMSMTTTLVAD